MITIEEEVIIIDIGDGESRDTTWGSITGTLSDQTDLKNALDAKADSTDLGTMAAVNDAPSNNKEYVRKNGNWSEASGGGGGGSAAWGTITGTLSDQTDLKNALDGKADSSGLGTMAAVNDAPSDSKEYVRKNGSWSEASGGGGGSAAWGTITGTLSDQTDLKNALDGKADSSGLGTMAAVNDAPSDSKEYVRKNGAWAEASGGGGGGSAAWGSITGTLSDQTDLQNALNGKADTTGETFTGDITIQKSDPQLLLKENGIDQTTAPGSDITGSPILITDANGRAIFRIEIEQGTTGKCKVSLAACRYVNAGGGEQMWTKEMITFSLSDTGAAEIATDYGSAWRSALELTGIAVRPDYTISDTDLTDGTSPLASGSLYFYYE